MTDESRQRNTYYEARIALALAKAAAAGQAASAAAAFKSVKASPFLAKGDGITNDGPAIQAALTALAGTGVSLWFPAGTYLISTAVTVPPGVTIWTTGAGGQIVLFTGGSAAAVANQAIVYGVAEGLPAYNPAWFALAAIFINPTSGSDQASGSTVGAPLKTWAEAVRRWGGTAPTLSVNLTITFQGIGHTDNSDPVLFTPTLLGGVSIILTGSLIQAWSGTATVAAAKNRATPQLLDVTLPAGAAPNQLVINTTHPSRAIIYKASAGNWLMSQPVLTPAPPFAMATGAIVEVNTWANGDAVTGNTLTAINLQVVAPIIADANATQTNALYITQCNGLDPLAGNFSSMYANMATIFVDTVLHRLLNVRPDESTTVDFSSVGAVNCATLGGCFVNGAPGQGPFWLMLAGIVGSTIGQAGQGYALDADVIVAAAFNGANVGGVTFLGLVFFDTGKNWALNGGLAFAINNFSFGGPIVWGPGGTLDIKEAGHLVYPTGGGAAVATFIQTATPLQLNGTATGSSVVVGAPSVINGGITLTAAHLDAAAGVAGFGGNAFNLGNASISNLGG